jgi:beta-ureidopropionase / N-carbamoyl-L-amino-acid hydrolase
MRKFRPMKRGNQRPHALLALVADSVKQLNLSTKILLSGATHDAESISRLAPIGIIFIPSIGGISHAPQKFSRPEDIANGVRVELRAVLELDKQNWYALQPPVFSGCW